jgi:hypothetical protein
MIAVRDQSGLHEIDAFVGMELIDPPPGPK